MQHIRTQRGVHLHRCLQWAVVCVGLAAPSLGAQTLFAWPTTGVNVSQYKTIEECFSATLRVKDSVRSWENSWADTMPLRRDDALRSFAVPVIQTAERCITQFDAHTMPIETWHFMFSLLLHANREAAADSLIARRLALITGTDSAATWLRGAVLDSVIERYLDVLPVRFSVIEQRVRERIALKASSALGMTGSLYELFVAARDAGRSELAVWSVTEFDVEIPRATDECRGDPFCLGMLRSRHRYALDYFARAVLLDSLRSNTAAYAVIKQANWSKASKKTGGPPLPIGKRAPVVQGDFWYDLQQQTDTVPVPLATPPVRPKPGMVSMVVFLTHECRSDGPDRLDARASPCLMDYAVFRRLAARFPELSMTIVSKTAGFYWYLEPLEPSAESAMLARWWPGYHKLPAVLAVSNTPFWRIEDPDRRRLNDPTPTGIAYSLDGTLNPGNTIALLVDREGMIVEAGKLFNKTDELELTEVIEILMKR